MIAIVQKYINSREVAEMVGKQHTDLIRDIKRYVFQLGESKIAFTDFFIESEYLTSQNKKVLCYDVTKKGCEFIAHKLTGTKGAAFTAKYINRFHEMEEKIPYKTPQGEELMALAVLEAQKTIARCNDEIERMKPKEIFADAVATSTTTILIGELAKILKQNGVDIGPKRLFEWMRENGYLIRQRGSSYNMPTQKAMELKLFEVKESTTYAYDGTVRIHKTTKVTGKGQQYFINKFFNTSIELI